MLHGGEPISRGTRYILAVFAYLAGPSPPEPGLAEGTCSANVLSDRYTAQQSEPAAEDACVSGIKKRTLESGEQSPCSAKKVATIANSFNVDANTEISNEKKIHSFNFML